MKPIHLNLSSTPFRDYRPMYGIALVLSIVSAILLIYNGQTAFRYLVETRETRRQIELLVEEIARQDAETKKIESSFIQVDLAAMNRRVAYINRQLADRAFSWTRLLEDLERVTPGDVRIVSLNPSVNESGNARLEMLCVAKSSDGMIRLINRMNDDPRFDHPFPTMETRNELGVSFQLGCDYLPIEESSK